MGKPPTYIRRDNEVVYPPPYQQAGTLLTAWPVHSPKAKQQAMLDAQLNACSGGTPYEYRALIDSVMVVLADIEKVSSLDREAARYGWTGEQDISFWVLCGAYVEHQGERRLDHLAFYVPYIWVTNADAMATGREAYGYPKSFAWAKLASSPEDPGPLWADGLVLPTFSPDTEVVRKRVLTLTRTSQAAPSRDPQDFDAKHGMEAFEAITKLVFGHGGADWNFYWSLLKDAIGGHLPMVFLKQFRSVESSELACYQAIVEANATVNDFRGAGLMPSGWELELPSYASVNIALNLGIKPQQTLARGFWVRFSFSMDLGKTVWSVGGAP